MDGVGKITVIVVSALILALAGLASGLLGIQWLTISGEDLLPEAEEPALDDVFGNG